MPGPIAPVSLSVVIPALNEAARIEQAVRQAWRAGADEVIVADGGSRDGTIDVARQAGAEVVQGAQGRGAQQNQGALHTRGSVLVFQHADNWFADAAFTPLKRLAGRSKTPVLGAFHQQIDAAGWRYRWLEIGNACRAGWGGRPYGDQGIFASRTLFFRVGGFPSVPLMEDVMFMSRARRRARPRLLNGPLHVAPRRWQTHGLVRQTVRNWSLLAAYHCGVSPRTLARHYRRHDLADRVKTGVRRPV